MPYIQFDDTSDPEAKLGFMGGSSFTPHDFTAPPSFDRQGIQEFFFQIFFPLDHTLSNYCAAFFFDLSNVDEDNIIPMFSTVDTYNNELSDNDLYNHHKYYSCFLFKKNEIEQNLEIRSPLVYKTFSFSENATTERFGQIDNSPAWIAYDETPPPCKGIIPTFGFQIRENFIFPKLASGPPQIFVDYFSESGFSESSVSGYEIFAGNEVYFFFFQYSQSTESVVCVQNSG